MIGFNASWWIGFGSENDIGKFLDDGDGAVDNRLVKYGAYWL